MFFPRRFSLTNARQRSNIARPLTKRIRFGVSCTRCAMVRNRLSDRLEESRFATAGRKRPANEETVRYHRRTHASGACSYVSEGYCVIRTSHRV